MSDHFAPPATKIESCSYTAWDVLKMYETQELATLRQISVLGQGSVAAMPDQIIVKLGVEQYADCAHEAILALNSRLFLVMTAVAEKGARQEDVHTTWMGASSCQPQLAQQFLGGGRGTSDGMPQANHIFLNASKPQPTGSPDMRDTSRVHMASSQVTHKCIASAWMRIALSNPSRLGELLDAASSAGVACYHVQSCPPSDESALRLNALEKATAHARCKAELLAQSQSMQLGSAIAIVEESTTYASGINGILYPMSGAEAKLVSANLAPNDLYIVTEVRATFEVI